MIRKSDITISYIQISEYDTSSKSKHLICKITKFIAIRKMKTRSIFST